MTKTNTPGFNCRVTVRFSADRNGRRLAHYLSRGAGQWRWIRMSTPVAESLVAGEYADLLPESLPAVVCS